MALYESGAMAEYVLDRYGYGKLQPSPGTLAAAHCRQWCWFAEATFARPLGEIVNHRRVAPNGELVEFVIEDCKARARTCIDAIEGVVATSPYLVGGTFSLADIMNGYTLMLADNFGVLTDDHPHTMEYYQRLGERPAFQVAREAG